ncbi:lytic transglycosylase [Streptomyces tateyamensis]|uniref:Lytic transglycosylase n=1 Tax=Streptomyces tateyamensis TaxID=565073 RepID=A0A2V4NF48_9ACTN|nr:transglycosylase SLT domain-containing protein [Streptomyces tateyamensis]PYC77846.1 lytic transglycosylase [Streptomyces tateyamensis]
MRLSRRQQVVAGLAAVAVAGAGGAYALSGGSGGSQRVTVADAPSAAAATDLTGAPSSTATAAPSPSASPSASGSASATPGPAASHSASARASASPSPSAKAQAAAAPAPTAKPGPVAPPPPPATPHTPPLQSGCKPSYAGANAATADVATALSAAAGKPRTLTLASGGTDKLPPLPVNLVKAVAWQESGWQSAIRACDGGIGTMQLMPATVTWMNGKFGTKNDAQTLAGNTDLGAELLDELVAYYGDSDFGGTYDLSPDPATGRTPLLDLVIAAYNAGAGNVHYTSTTDPVTGVTTGTSVIPNPGYVANVKALMANCPCQVAPVS